MKAQQVVMTPEWAAKLLESNTGNRRLVPSWVRTLSLAIESGDWRLTHQGIAVARDGRLLDGQHRCAAIVKAGISVPTMLFTDVDPATFVVLDQGKKRGLADVFGEPNHVMGAIRYLAALHKGTSGATTDDCRRVLDSVFGDVVKHFYARSSQRAKIVGSAAATAAAAVRGATGGNVQYVSDVFYAMNNANFGDCPPIALAFLKQVNTMKSAKLSQSMVFVRALKVFDEKERENKTLVVRAPEEAMLWARERMDDVFGKPREMERIPRAFGYRRLGTKEIEARA